MAANEKAQPVAPGQTREILRTEILSQNGQSVNQANWLHDFRARHPKIKGTEIVEAIRLSFPGFDKTLLSKCLNPEKYGVKLTPEAMNQLINHFEERK